jgi:hypothetical protein
MAQFLVQWLAFQYASSASALNYFSIVGTSVSIILALIAIFYSFIQTGSADNLGAQVSKMDSVVDQIARASSTLDREIDVFESAAKSLHKSLDVLGDSHSQLHELKSSMQSWLQQNQIKNDERPDELNLDAARALIKTVFLTLNSCVVKNALLSIVIASPDVRKYPKQTDVFQTFLLPEYNDTDELSKDQNSFLLGVFKTTADFVTSLDIHDVPKERIISQELEKIIVEYLDQNPPKQEKDKAIFDRLRKKVG